MTNPKSFVLGGKRIKLDPRVPTSEIEWLGRRRHVSESEAEVRADIESRCTAFGWTPRLVRNAGDYAVFYHLKLRELFHRAVG